MNRMLKLCFLIWIVLFIMVFQGYAEEISEENQMNSTPVRVGFHMGFSQFTGFLGLELNRGHWAATLGLPESIGILYYLDERGCRWFMGAHAMYFTLDDEETEDGVTYDEQTYGSAGVGVGYKWRWRNHWDLSLSVSVDYCRDLLENDYMERREDYIIIIPGLTVGYTF